jgi:hypothetical protein
MGEKELWHRHAEWRALQPTVSRHLEDGELKLATAR